jgi:hypothetical protein
LSWNNLQGASIPWEFQGLRNLKDLFLKSNQLEGKLPDIMDVWGNLENMVVSLNSFTGALPSGLHHMTSLGKWAFSVPVGSNVYKRRKRWLTLFIPVQWRSPETLHLDGNKFNGTIPPELGSLSGKSSQAQSRGNYIDSKNVEKLLMNLLVTGSELRDLRLDYNNFHGVVPAEIGKLEWLGKSSVENISTGCQPPTR